MEQLDADTIEAMMRDYDAGMPMREMATKYGVHHKVITSLRRRLGLPGRRRTVSKETLEEVKRRLEQV